MSSGGVPGRRRADRAPKGTEKEELRRQGEGERKRSEEECWGRAARARPGEGEGPGCGSEGRLARLGRGVHTW